MKIRRSLNVFLRVWLDIHDEGSLIRRERHEASASFDIEALEYTSTELKPCSHVRGGGMVGSTERLNVKYIHNDRHLVPFYELQNVGD